MTARTPESSGTPDAPGGVLPLFPLRSVLFPGGRLRLQVFEARYLDLVAGCVREGRGFGVVCLAQGSEVRQPGAPAPRFEPVGVLARVVELDAPAAGRLQVRCAGARRFRHAQATEGENGLWQARGVQWLPDDALKAVPAEHLPVAVALGRAYAALVARGDTGLPPERELGNAGWVANRWCELLPLSLAARQQLMALADPLQRLDLVARYLRDQRLV